MTIALLSALLIGGCSTNSAATSTSSATASTAAASSVTTAAASASGAAASVELAGLDAAGKAGFDEDDSLITWDAGSSTAIALSGSGAAVTGSGATAEGGVVTITAAGTYVVSGSIEDGQIVINAPDNTVHLVLNGAQIANNDGPAIYVQEAGKTIVTLQDGTNNTVADGAAYADTSEEAPTAAIYSKGDLTINGTGTLGVEGSYKDGITSKDDLKIMSGTITVKAADDGIVGKDLVAVKDGAITVDAGGDGVKTTNDTDTDKGYVAITGGTFNIKAVNDGIQAEAAVLVDGGTFDIVTGGGSAASTKVHADDRGRGFGGQAAATTESADTGTESSSAKGLKGAAGILITNGTFKIDGADDALHSNADLVIAGGTFSLASGDDSVHAENTLSISGGTIDITKTYEGLEGTNIAISGGDIHVVSDDDGVNVGGTSDSGDKESPTNGMLTISGGYIYVLSSGDSLDSNGSMTMSGGTAVLNGPTGQGELAIDYNGTFEQTGGYLVAAGSGHPSTSTQLAVVMTFPSTIEVGTLVTLTDSSGKAITAYEASKSFGSLTISSADLKSGEEYTISTGGTSSGTATDGLYEGGTVTGSTKVVTFTMGDSITYVNESGVTDASSANAGGFGAGGRGGFGGDRGGDRGGMKPDAQSGASATDNSADNSTNNSTAQ